MDIEKVSDEDVANLLERAADLYESEQIDWCQGGLVHTDVCEHNENLGLGDTPLPATRVIGVCAMGALMMAAGIDMLAHQNGTLHWRPGSGYGELMVPVRHVQFLLEKANNGSVEYWNDQARRTKQEVIDLFKETAKGLRNAGGKS